MASEASKKQVRRMYVILNIIQWSIVGVMTVLVGLGIHFAEGSSGYWGGGLAVLILLLLNGILSLILVKTMMKHDKDAFTKKDFYDRFNLQGFLIVIGIGACIAGIATGAAIGSRYGSHNDKNTTDTNQNEDDKFSVNPTANKTISIIQAVCSAVVFLIMVRTICYHGEFRRILGVPEKPSRPTRPREAAVKRARRIYIVMTVIQGTLVLVLAVLVAMSIHFADGTSGYWGGGLAALLMTFFVGVQGIVITRSIKTYQKNDQTMRAFIDNYNWQGIMLFLCIGACIAGIATGAAIGSRYAKERHDKSYNSTDTNNDDNDSDNYVNIEENRIMGTLLSVFSGVALLIAVGAIIYHGEIRTALGIPQNANQAQTQPTPVPPAPPAQPAQPAQPKPAAKATNSQAEIALLTTQNNLLKEQNALQKQQLEQMTALNQHLQRVSASIDAGPLPPPPDYQSVFETDLTSGHAFPHGLDQGKSG